MKPARDVVELFSGHHYELWLVEDRAAPPLPDRQILRGHNPKQHHAKIVTSGKLDECGQRRRTAYIDRHQNGAQAVWDNGAGV